MSTKPVWLLDAIKKDKQQRRPNWLRKAIEGQNTEVEETEEVTFRYKAKAEGDFPASLRATIRDNEAPRFGYDSWYGRGTSRGPVSPPKNPTSMTVDEVLLWQNTHNPDGPETTAVGAYQIVDQPNARTLSWLKRRMNLTGSEMFSPELQDRMADTLMERRGLSKFLSGNIDGDTFANRIAREWASLPVLKNTRRGRRDIKIGQSYYAGDGINKAFRGKNKLATYKELYALADINSIV